MSSFDSDLRLTFRCIAYPIDVYVADLFISVRHKLRRIQMDIYCGVCGQKVDDDAVDLDDDLEDDEEVEVTFTCTNEACGRTITLIIEPSESDDEGEGQ